MKKLLFFLAMAIVFAMQLPAQVAVVVGDTTTSNTTGNYPVEHYFNNSICEIIYYSDELMPGLIQSISFWHTSSPWSNGTYTIYMKEVPNTSFSSGTYLPGDGWTLVYNATNPLTTGWVTFTLNTPFVYTGGNNLAVAVLREGTQYSYGHNFKYTLTPEQTCIYTANDNTLYSVTNPPSSGSPSTTRPVTKFDMGDLEGFCFPPVGLHQASVSETEVTIAWSEYDEGSTFGIAYRLLGDEDWTELSSSINDTTYTISGLDSYTRYEVKVWTICENDNSDEMIIEVITLPTSDNFITIPYEQNFDELADLESWSLWNVTNNGLNRWYLGTVGAKLEGEDAAGNGLYISADGGMSNEYTHTSTSSHLSTLISIEEGNYYGIEFDYRAVGELGWDDVVVSLYPVGEELPTSNSLNSSYMVGSSNSNAGQWVKVSIPFPNDLEPGAYQLVLSWRNDSGGGSSPAASLDNLHIFATSCARVNTFETAMEDADGSVTMTVTVTDEMNEGAEYLLEYRYTGDTTWYSVQSESPVAVTGLPYASKVEYRVTASCGGELAVTSDTYTEWTLCTSVTELPYEENFDENIFIPLGEGETRGNRNALNCWYNINGAYSSYYWSSISSNNGIDGSKALYFFGTTSTSSYDFSDWFISPEIELTGNERLNFQYKKSSNTNSPVIDIFILNTEENDYASMADTANFVYVSSVNTASSDVSQYNMAEVMLNDYSGSYHLALAVRQKSSTFYIDNLSISEIPACPEVYGLSATAVSDESIAITYNTANVLETGVVIAYSEITEETTEFDPETATTVTVPFDAELPFVLDGLTPGTPYYIAAAQDCGGVFSEPVVVTTPVIYTVPMISDFDTPLTSAVVTSQSNNENAWVIGTATNNTVDESGAPTTGGALYISNNGGTSFAYSTSTSSTTYSYAKIPVEFTTDSEYLEYEISFDYTAGGEASIGSTYAYYYDYLKVFLVPDTVAIPNTSELPDSYAITENLFLTNGAWNHHVSLFTGLEGVYNLVFMWRNDTGGGTQPSAAIDNLRVVGLTCSGAVVDASVGFVEDETSNSLVVNLTDLSNEGVTYNVSFAPQGGTFTEETGLTLSDFPYLLAEDVAFNSTYSVEVEVVCPDGIEVLALSTTVTTPVCQSVPAPWSEVFDTDPFTSNCWARYSGVLPSSGVVSTSNLTSNTGWTRTTRDFNGISVEAVKANIYSTNRGYWFVTPNINLGTDGETIYQLGFDAALTDYGNTNPVEQPAPDDKLIVFVSRDGGSTWNINNALVFAENDADTEH
ncbi:MAG: fibronectin type III domain-containing protein, partial [Bacteroidales bacterium]|nr:fibronectin type III domain-containing protein [Bacteroidales bacterium]